MIQRSDGELDESGLTHCARRQEIPWRHRRP
jgi:hypothetical protein